MRKLYLSTFHLETFHCMYIMCTISTCKILHYTNFQATFIIIVCFTYKFSTCAENKICRTKHIENLFENNWAGCFKG